MSVFSDIPSPFPLIVSLKQRPVFFRLECDGAERVATLMLTLLWGLAIPAALFWIADPFAPWPDGAIPIGRAAALAGLVVFCSIGVRSWLWPNIRAAITRVDVTISETNIEVVEKGLLGARRWSKPIAEYRGVAIENWGTRTVGNDKIPVSAVMLVHADDRFSVPLHIDGALRVKASLAKGKAEQLGLPLIDAPRFGIGAAAHARGTIVANHGQALKVRLLYALLGVAGLAVAAAALAGSWSHGGTGALVLAALGFSISAAIHVFAGCYVIAMRRSGQALEIQTAALSLGAHRIDVSGVRAVRYREGRGGAGTAHATHTPWVKLEVAGALLPFIIDMQSDYVDEQALLDLSGKP
jgi:hypothetical protein